MKTIWAERARIARKDLINFIAEDNVLAALEVDDTISAAVLRLEQFPSLGKPGRIDGTRELVVHQHYILVYEVVDENIIILMVLHTSRQWPPEYAD
jgi:addiction module RelE/StbE family toxin